MAFDIVRAFTRFGRIQIEFSYTRFRESLINATKPMLVLKAVPRHCPLVVSLRWVKNLSHWRITVVVFGLKSAVRYKKKNKINFFPFKYCKHSKEKKPFLRSRLFCAYPICLLIVKETVDRHKHRIRSVGLRSRWLSLFLPPAPRPRTRVIVSCNVIRPMSRCSTPEPMCCNY